MTNLLPINVVADIRRLRIAGYGIRKISRELGISKNTVSRYVTSEDGAKCGCGKDAGHNGWCKHRYGQSVLRQAYHARRRGVEMEVPKIERKSRIREAVREKEIWLGVTPFQGKKLARDEWLGAVGEVDRHTQKIAIDVRQDVRHEMYLACFEGRLPREDIGRSVPTFVGYVYRHCTYRGIQLSPILEDAEGRLF